MYVSARYLHSWHTCPTFGCFSFIGLNVWEKKCIYLKTGAFELQRTHELWWQCCRRVSTIPCGARLSPCWISVAVREHKFLQPAQYSSAECWFLASLEPLFLSCPFQPQTTATKFKCYQSWPVFKQGRVYTCMIQTLLRSTFTTKVINLSMKQIIFWALQDMANLIETGKLTACWKKKY